jgi:hypothetical protein
MTTQRSFSTYYELQLGRDVTDADSLAIDGLLDLSARAARPTFSPPTPDSFFTTLPNLNIHKKNYRGYRQELNTQEKIVRTEKEVFSSKICF